MDVLHHAPALSAAEAVDLARRLYELDAEASALPSERDQNFRLQTPTGDRFVLKIANSTDGRALLEAQNAALVYVARRTRLCPRVVPARDGSAIAETTSASGARHFVRLLTWVDGEPLGAITEQPADLLADLGRSVAELDAALEGFDHPAIHRDFYWDLAQGLPLVREWAPLVEDPAMRGLVTSVAERIEREDAPRFARLRRAAVHNDPNDYNVLVSLPPKGGSHEIEAENLPPEGGSHGIFSGSHGNREERARSIRIAWLPPSGGRPIRD
jgi:Ser/Thr protein kinase RdoA (MazF antagonist)